MAKEPRNWMPFYIGAYLKNTQRLTTEQHGAYLLLIFEYWNEQGPLPDDDEELSAICRLPLKRWQAIRGKIARFFVVDKGVWWHERVETEIKTAWAKVNANRENGKLGGRPPKDEETQNEPEGL